MLVNRKPFRDIAGQMRLSKSALVRHHDDHLPALVAQAKQAAEVAQADDLLAQVRGLRSKAVSILLKAEQQGDLRTALAAIREARGCLELLLEVEGELDRRPTFNLVLAPEWLVVRGALLAALAPYAEARQAVAHALLGMEGNHGGH
jgi:hypothetical protein